MRISIDTSSDSISDFKRVISLLQQLVAEKEGSIYNSSSGVSSEQSDVSFTPLFGFGDEQQSSSTPNEPEKKESVMDKVTFIPYE